MVQILEVLGYNTDMVNGNKLDPLEEPPEDFQISLDFDMSKYADESWAARPFANALKVTVKPFMQVFEFDFESGYTGLQDVMRKVFPQGPRKCCNFLQSSC